MAEILMVSSILLSVPKPQGQIRAWSTGSVGEVCPVRPAGESSRIVGGVFMSEETQQ